MSFTLPTNYGNTAKLGNIKENILVQLGYDEAFDAAAVTNFLDGGINDTDLVFDVIDGTEFSVGDVIQLENEFMRIDAISTNALTVVRGWEGSTAASHADETAISFYNFRALSIAPQRFGEVNYRGVISKNILIRTSMDLDKQTAKTSNVSLLIKNFKFQGDDFSADIFSAAGKNFMNREVRIYSRLPGSTQISDCFRIATLRMKQPSHDKGNIIIPLESATPWDFLSIPNEKSSTFNNFFPAIYGAFTPETSTKASKQFCIDAVVYPLPVDLVSNEDFTCLAHKVLTAGRLHFYEENAHHNGGDVVVPLDEANNSSITYEGGNAIKTNISLDRGFKIRPNTVNEGGNYSLLASPDNMIDTDEDSAAEFVLADFVAAGLTASYGAGGGTDSQSLSVLFDAPQFEHEIQSMVINYKLSVDFETSGGGAGAVGSADIDDVTYAENDNLVNELNKAGVFSYAAQYSAATKTPNGQMPNLFSLSLNFDWTADDNGQVDSISYKIYDINIELVFKIPTGETAKGVAVNSAIENIKQLFCGEDGLPESWSGGSGAITEIHEAHRDMLIRYAGMTTDTPYNWSANLDIDAIKNWTIRWWQSKPVDMEKTLVKLQFEGGFIFKFRADNSPSYWFIKDSYSSSDVAAIITDADGRLEKNGIKASPFSQLLTKMNLNYERHPVQDRYKVAVTSENASARTAWKIKTKENIKEVGLDIYIAPTIPTTPHANANNDFYSYRNNMFGDIKLLVNYNITNPKWYGLETGDTIQFNLASIDPFGYVWTDLYFLILDHKRGLNSLKIKTRQVFSD